MPGGTNLRFRIVGDRQMHCGGCEASVETALSYVPGVQHVQADRVEQLVSVAADANEVEVEELRQQLKMMGYESELAGPTT